MEKKADEQRLKEPCSCSCGPEKWHLHARQGGVTEGYPGSMWGSGQGSGSWAPVPGSWGGSGEVTAHLGFPGRHLRANEMLGAKTPVTSKTLFCLRDPGDGDGE